MTEFVFGEGQTNFGNRNGGGRNCSISYISYIWG